MTDATESDLREIEDTYPHPEHGWTCFHCGETFHVQAKAREHFGQTPDSEPGCVLKLTAEDRQLLRRLRAQEIINAELTTDLHNETTLSQHHSHATRTELMGFKPFRQCSTVQDAFNVYDSMEGRALAAEESLAATRAERDALAALVDEFIEHGRYPELYDRARAFRAKALRAPQTGGANDGQT